MGSVKEGKAYPVTDAMRALLRGPMTEAWKKPEAPEKFRRWDRATTTIAMMTYLSEYALWCGALSPIHRQATLVFCLLSMVYINMAVTTHEHDDHGHEEHGEHAHSH